MCQYLPYTQPMAHNLQIRVSDDFCREVDEWRRAQPDIPTRSEAVRRLVELGLKAAPKPPNPRD